MPVPAGTGLDRRSFLLRSTGLASVRLRRQPAGVERLRGGDRKAAAGPAQPILLSIFLSGGIDSLSVLAPTADPEYRKLRPTLALGESDGKPFTEDTRLRWHPAAASLAALHGEGKLTVMPGVGYDHPDQSHFNSRHFWEVGALDRQLRTGWMGRYLDRVGAPDNPLQGLAFDGRLAPALATTRAPIATVNGRGTFDFGAPNVWGQVEELDVRGCRARSHDPCRSKDPAMRQAGATAAQASTLRSQLAPFDESKITSPVAYPTEGGASRGPGGARRDDRGGNAAALRVGHGVRRVRHSRQPARRPRGGAEGGVRLAARLPARPRGARDRRPRARPRLVGVRPPRRGERICTAPTTAPPESGSCWAPRARDDDRRVPRARTVSTRTGTCAPTSDFRALYCSLLEQWLGTDAAAVIPNAGRFGRVPLLK